MLGLRNSFQALTAGCEIRGYSDGYLCVIHGMPVREDDTRCQSFVRRRVYTDGDDETLEQIGDYVNQVLGIRKGKNFRRLVGLQPEPETGEQIPS